MVEPHLWRDGKVVGTITSGEWGHRVNLNLAYAFVNITTNQRRGHKCI
jgi:glycine cleavage system aminomethyltransferase T